MREYKFRAKGIRENKDKWFVGSLFIEDGMGITYIRSGVATYYETNYLTVEVNSKTVGQYTGHSDVMGTDMYEGDIVTGYFEEDEWPATVEWDEVGARFVLSGQNSVIPFDEMGGLEVTIIGNVHDNPELLKGSD